MRRKLTKPSQRMVHGRRHRKGLRERQHRRPQNVAGDVWTCAAGGADGYVLERCVFQGVLIYHTYQLLPSVVAIVSRSNRPPCGVFGPPFSLRHSRHLLCHPVI